MSRQIVLLFAVTLMLAGCGSQRESDAAYKQKVQQSLSKLSEDTQRTAKADISTQSAERKHALAVKHLRAVERHIREGTTP